MRTKGLGAASVRNGVETLAMTHCKSISVYIMNLDHTGRVSISSRLQGGQVNINANNDITRSASVQFWDPEHQIGLDNKSPMDAARYYNKMIQIVYNFWRPGASAASRFSIPIFTGPVNSVKRQGGVLDVACVGKEALAKHAFWNTMTIAKGANKIYALKQILRYRSGENRFSFVSSTAKMGKQYSYTREHIVWDEAKKIARGMGMRLFYDGAGDLVLRPDRATIVHTFKDGPGGSVLSAPSISFDDSEVVNVVYVKGGVPKGKNKKQAVAYATLPTSHPLNHNRIGRNGTARILLKTIERTDLIKVSDCVNLAKVELDRAADQQLSVTFDALANPFIEEGDYVQVNIAGDFALNFRLNEMSIPLVGVSSSIGQVRNLNVRRKGDKPKAKGRRIKVPKKKTKKKSKKKKKGKKK